jgi:hypothetical protein
LKSASRFPRSSKAKRSAAEDVGNKALTRQNAKVIENIIKQIEFLARRQGAVRRTEGPAFLCVAAINVRCPEPVMAYFVCARFLKFELPALLLPGDVN